MKKSFFALSWIGFLFFCSAMAEESIPSSPPSSSISQVMPSSEEEGIVLFTPPAGWHLADSKALSSHVKVMVVGKGPSSFPPSMNLSAESYKGTLRQYLKTIKSMNSAQGYDWKDLGVIKTEAGHASLSQVDTKTQWGDVRLMHAIILKNGHIYILTASALKDEFSIFYKDFFAAMRSLKVVKDMYEMVNPQQRIQLKAAVNQLQTQWQSLLTQKQNAYPETNWAELQQNIFDSEEFQNKMWNPFKAMLNQKYGDLGAEWQSLFLQKVEDQLFNVKSNQ